MDNVSNHDQNYMEQNHHPILLHHYKQNPPLDLDMLYLKVEDTLDLSNHQSQPQLKHLLCLCEKHDAYGTLHSLMYYLSRIL